MLCWQHPFYCRGRFQIGKLFGLANEEQLLTGSNPRGGWTSLMHGISTVVIDVSLRVHI